MFKKVVNLSVMALIAIGLFGSLPAATAGEPVLIVVPSNYTSVQMAFDVAKLRRDILIVSYSELGVKVGQPLYTWDSVGNAWVKTTFADYNSGNIFAVKPQRAIIIGSEKDVPPVLAEISSWCPDVKRIPTLAILDVMNSLNESFRFTSPEWKWLAKEYDLKLEDKNAERRRYGKYGKPGERSKTPMPTSPVSPTSAVTPAPVSPAPVVTTGSSVEVPAAPVMIQSEAPETTTKKSRPENK